MTGTGHGWRRIVRGWLVNLRPSRWQASKPVLAAAAGALLVGGVLAWRALGLTADDIQLGPLLVSALLVPVSVLLLAFEFQAIGRLVGTRITLGDAMRVSVIGSVANLLPIPGAALVRLDSLKEQDVPWGTATRSVLGVGLIWSAISLSAAGLGAFASASAIVGLTLVCAAAATLVAAWALVPSGSAPLRWWGVTVAIEVVAVGLGATRILMTFAALGLAATWGQAFTLVMAGAVSSIIGVVPAGLGVREGIAGGVAATVGLSFAEGFLVTGLVRVVWLVVQAPVALMTTRFDSRRHAAVGLP